jgi:hypothetical protein
VEVAQRLPNTAAAHDRAGELGGRAPGRVA